MPTVAGPKTQSKNHNEVYEMKFANKTHKRILDGIRDEVLRFQRDSSGKKSAYKEGWEEAMSTAE